MSRYMEKKETMLTHDPFGGNSFNFGKCKIFRPHCIRNEDRLKVFFFSLFKTFTHSFEIHLSSL